VLEIPSKLGESDGTLLEGRVFIPIRFFSIERLFSAYNLDINDQHCWNDPRIVSWYQALSWVQDRYPDVDVVPSDPPHLFRLSEPCDDVIICQDVLYSPGCPKVYRDLAASNGGFGVQNANHQMMAVVNVRLRAVKRLHLTNHWNTHVTPDSHAPPQDYQAFNPGGGGGGGVAMGHQPPPPANYNQPPPPANNNQPPPHIPARQFADYMRRQRRDRNQQQNATFVPP